jgi:hypothetical protein
MGASGGNRICGVRMSVCRRKRQKTNSSAVAHMRRRGAKPQTSMVEAELAVNKMQ